MRGSVQHSASRARRTKSSPLAREPDDDFVATPRTDGATKTPAEDAAVEVVPKFALDKPGKPLPVGALLHRLGEKGRQVLLDHLVEQGLFWLAPAVPR